MKYNKGFSSIVIVLIVIGALGIYFLQKNSGTIFNFAALALFVVAAVFVISLTAGVCGCIGGMGD